MTHHFNVSGEGRKRLVKAIAEHLGLEAKYLGVPSCAYQIGTYTVSKDGDLSWADMDDADPKHLNESSALVYALEDAGFHSREMAFWEDQQRMIDADEKEDAADEEPAQEEQRLTISLPRKMFNDFALENLKALIGGKGTLMKRAFQAESLEITVTDEAVDFPWFNLEDADTVQAYTIFIQKITEMAIKQSRISAKEKEIVNEKYEFRCFLLRLGLIGDEYKAVRKTLLRNLSGSSAFKCGHKKGGEEA